MSRLDKIQRTLLNKKFENLLNGNVSLISIYGRPLQNNNIFLDVIEKTLKKEEKILYVWGKEECDKKIVSHIQSIGKSYSYSRSGCGNTDITFMDFKYLYNVSKNYDLIIIDDVSTYFKLDSKGLLAIYTKIKKHTKKLIVFTIESIAIDKEGIDISSLKSTRRFVEPRGILTRVDLKEDIPYILYDYLNWFKETRKKVMFYVPYYEDIESLYMYYNNLRLENVKIVKAEKKNLDKDVLKVKDRAIFIITNKMEDILSVNNIDHIVTMFADNPKIEYKKIIFMCAKLGEKINKNPELILVSREETKDIENAKLLTREFNKRLWKECH